MTTQADIDADLTLEIDGRVITPEKFMRGVQAFFGLIKEVTRTIVDSNQFVHWKVQVKDGSNLIGIAPSSFTVPASVLDAIYITLQEGIESLENDAAHPEGLPDTALRHIRELASIVGTDEYDDTKIRVWTQKRPTAITHKAVAHIAILLNEKLRGE